MNTENKINVHYSSLVGLKAELLRKQAEVEAAKSKLENVKNIHKPKTKDKRSKDKYEKKLEENGKSKDKEDLESIKAHKKSKLMLQAKSKLYEKLSKKHVNMNPHFLVDFEHKSDDSDHSEKQFPNRSESNDYSSEYDSDGEWAEYTDCFGRTRKCLKDDLKKMQEEDKHLREKIIKKPHEEKLKTIFYKEDRMPEKEPEIEIMRRKWEEQSAKIADKGDIHYQDVLFDEARSHGVGYYAFSQDEDERAKQQADLFKLRRETERKQKESQQTQEMKDRMHQNRLKAAQMRKRIRAGLPAEENDDSIINHQPNKKQKLLSEEQDKIDYEKLDSEDKSIEEQTESKVQDDKNEVRTYEELLGKRNQWYVMSQEEWVHKKRKERSDEFAPVYKNFPSDGSFSSSRNSEDSKNMNNSPENIVGPMPSNEDAVIGHMAQTSRESVIGSVSSSSSLGSTNNGNIDIAEQVEAGLKYLRRIYEKKNA